MNHQNVLLLAKATPLSLTPHTAPSRATISPILIHVRGIPWSVGRRLTFSDFLGISRTTQSQPQVEAQLLSSGRGRRRGGQGEWGARRGMGRARRGEAGRGTWRARGRRWDPDTQSPLPRGGYSLPPDPRLCPVFNFLGAPWPILPFQFLRRH